MDTQLKRHSFNTSLTDLFEGNTYQQVGEGGAGCQGLNDSPSLHGQQGVSHMARPQLDDAGGDVGLPPRSFLLVLLNHRGQALQNQVQSVLP